MENGNKYNTACGRNVTRPSFPPNAPHDAALRHRTLQPDIEEKVHGEKIRRRGKDLAACFI
jgi:hypothetical protein